MIESLLNLSRLWLYSLKSMLHSMQSIQMKFMFGNGIPFNGKVHRWLEIQETGTSEEYKDFDYTKLFESEYLLDKYSDGNLYVAKFNIPNFDNGIVKENFTYAHFDKGDIIMKCIFHTMVI